MKEESGKIGNWLLALGDWALGDWGNTVLDGKKGHLPSTFLIS